MHDKYWMKIALKLAKKAKSKNEIPVGAILVLNKKIIGEGWNQSIRTHDPTSHAEIVAIRKGGKKIRNYRILNSTLYVTLKPCLMCLGALIHARIQKLVFGANENKNSSYSNLLYDTFKNNKIYSFEIKKGVLEKDCKNQLRNFFYKKRK